MFPKTCKPRRFALDRWGVLACTWEFSTMKKRKWRLKLPRPNAKRRNRGPKIAPHRNQSAAISNRRMKDQSGVPVTTAAFACFLDEPFDVRRREVFPLS